MKNLKIAFLLVLLMCSLALAQQTRTPLPVPDIPGYKTLKADFHMHTIFSDGNVWPTVRVGEAWRDGLDVIAITDHLEYNRYKDDVKIEAGRAYAIARPVAQQLGIILVPAVEITKTMPAAPAHFNALFVSDPAAINNPDLMTALRAAKAQNAFVFWNHPGWRVPKAEWFPHTAAAYDEKLFSGMEIYNDHSFYAEAYPWISEKNLTMFANSDVHDPMSPPSGGKLRPVTLVFARAADLAGVREALDARRTAAWADGQLWGAEEQLRPLLERAVTAENPELSARPGSSIMLRVRNSSAIPFTYRIKAPAWLTTADNSLAAEAISLLRGSVAKTAPAGEQRVALELEVTNAWVGPGRNLTARIPLSLTVK
jgi:hypothetical protein